MQVALSTFVSFIRGECSSMKLSNDKGTREKGQSVCASLLGLGKQMRPDCMKDSQLISQHL
jgi:hypothetical protein